MDLLNFCFSLFFKGDQATVVAEEETSKEPVIIEVSEGLGSAVFSLVYLIDAFTEDQGIQDQELNAQSLNLLKQSSDARINMLSHILRLLGMTCRPRKVPELTPIFLLANKLVSIEWTDLTFAPPSLKVESTI